MLSGKHIPFILIYSIITFLSIVLIGCTSKEAKMLKKLMNEPIKLEEFDNQISSSEYTILRYVKPTACTSCQLKMGRWRIYRKLMKSKYNNVTILFIIATENTSEVRKIMNMYNFSMEAIIDSVGDFTKSNPTISSFGSDITILLDENKNVLAVGDPSDNTHNETLYNEIISKNISR